MQNRQIADIIEEMATLMELAGDNPFKCRAFHNAARLISISTGEMSVHAEAGTLTTLKGIGKGLAPIIADLALKGTSDELSALRRSVHPGLLDMLKVEGLGPKKVRLLYEKLGINSLDTLRRAAEEGKLTGLSGFGGKSRDNILRNLALLDRYRDKRLLREAETAGESVLAAVSSLPGVTVCSLAGSIRRRMSVIGDIDVLAAAPEKTHAGIIAGFGKFQDTGRVISSGPTKSSVMLDAGIRCDLRVVTPAAYPFALQYFTGSKAHNTRLRTLAKSLGWSLNEYGFTAIGNGGTRRCRTEEDLYDALGLEYIPPELREDTGEIEAASEGTLPRRIGDGELRGTFHCHTTWSDGRNSVAEMASAARELGWEYIGIADHSKAASYAGGLSVKDVTRQIAEIEELNARMRGFRIFAGSEVDILPGGSLDWDDRTLGCFDYVVASVHSGFRMSEAEATQRIIRALKHKHVTMLGHPTGRLLLEREGYPVNVKSVIDAAADYGKIIEINANPRRLDLDWSHCRYARDRGVLISINPDAHAVAGLRDVRYGVGVARKGWLEPKDVLNTLGLTDVTARLSASRARAGR